MPGQTLQATALVHEAYLVSILQGNGDGTFQAARNYAAGNTSQSLAVTDFNGDGKLDLVTANPYGYTYGRGQVSVLLGNGDSTFQPVRTIFTGGSNAGSVAVGDFNADGKMDLAVSGSTPYSPPYSGYYGYSPAIPQTSEVTVLLGHGDGTFAASSRHDLGSVGGGAIDNGAVYRPGNGRAMRYRKVGGIYYHARTPVAVVQALEQVRSGRQRVRIHHGDVRTGRGRIGNSMGRQGAGRTDHVRPPLQDVSCLRPGPRRERQPGTLPQNVRGSGCRCRGLRRQMALRPIRRGVAVRPGEAGLTWNHMTLLTDKDCQIDS